MIKTTYTLEECTGDKNSIYLAGPTVRITEEENTHKATSWRSEALSILKEINFDGEVIIPEWKHFARPVNWTYSRQVDWELDAMKKATVILFWIPRDLATLPGFTTNVEFGEWLDSNKIIVGAPKDTPKIRYIFERCARSKIPWMNDLRGCIDWAVDMIKKLNNEDGKTWITADTHFGHARTLELSKRPFRTVEEMDWELIKKWNEAVGNDDQVFHLGDFGNPDIVSHLKGRIIFIVRGNYDNDDIMNKLKCDSKIVELNAGHDPIFNGKRHCLVHAPEDAKYFYKGGFILFGHIHKLQMVKSNGLNVGVDCHDFRPIDIETVSFYKNAIENHYDENVFMDLPLA